MDNVDKLLDQLPNNSIVIVVTPEGDPKLVGKIRGLNAFEMGERFGAAAQVVETHRQQMRDFMRHQKRDDLTSFDDGYAHGSDPNHYTGPGMIHDLRPPPEKGK